MKKSTFLIIYRIFEMKIQSISTEKLSLHLNESSKSKKLV